MYMHICIHAYIKCACVFPRGLQICKWFNFSILGQGVQAAHPVLHQQRHWMKAGDIWPDQSDVPAIMPFRLWILWFTHSGDRTQLVIFKHVWVQWPITSTFTNREREREIYIYIYEPREQTFCLTSVWRQPLYQRAISRLTPVSKF